jgi:hypothetical protein
MANKTENILLARRRRRREGMNERKKVGKARKEKERKHLGRKEYNETTAKQSST